jgi:hypothetical protein
MAITLSQFPTSPNMANNNLLFTVSSNTSSAAQYQFVATVSLSGSSSGASGILQIIKQQPNPNGFGVFDVGQIISNYVDSDNNWKTAQFSTASEAGKRFQVRLGEEYATSISGTVIQYTGIGNNIGLPAVTASAYTYILNGLVEPNDKINWNWPSGSYFTASAVSTTTTFSKQHALTNAPLIQSIQDGEYATISLINGNFTDSTSSAQDIYEVEVTVFDSANNELDQYNLSNLVSNGGGPRTATTQLWSNVVTSQSAGTQLITVGVGPQNLTDGGNTLPSDWAYYTVRALGQQAASTTNTSGSYATLRYEKQGPQCGYDGVRFAWKNEFGVWDYYTFTLQNTKETNIERQQFEQSFVNFSTPNPTVAYDRQRRGKKPFYNKLTSNQTANSNWLDQGEADWLKELFFSTNVFVQEGTDFFPIAITTANLVEKTNPRTQKTFQYVIEFQAANQPTPRI